VADNDPVAYLGGDVSGDDDVGFTDEVAGNLGGATDPQEEVVGNLGGATAPEEEMAGSLGGATAPAEEVVGSLGGATAPEEEVAGNLGGATGYQEEVAGNLGGATGYEEGIAGALPGAAIEAEGYLGPAEVEAEGYLGPAEVESEGYLGPAEEGEGYLPEQGYDEHGQGYLPEQGYQEGQQYAEGQVGYEDGYVDPYAGTYAEDAQGAYDDGYDQSQAGGYEDSYAGGDSYSDTYGGDGTYAGEESHAGGEEQSYETSYHYDDQPSEGGSGEFDQYGADQVGSYADTMGGDASLAGDDFDESLPQTISAADAESIIKRITTKKFTPVEEADAAAAAPVPVRPPRQLGMPIAISLLALLFIGVVGVMMLAPGLFGSAEGPEETGPVTVKKNQETEAQKRERAFKAKILASEKAAFGAK